MPAESVSGETAGSGQRGGAPTQPVYFLVRVDAANEDLAEQVERIHHDEDYGFDYTVEWYAVVPELVEQAERMEREAKRSCRS